MNILDFINNLPQQANKAVVKPNVEDQCPNLDVVRKHLKQYVLDQPALPDCEINYDLGYVYDPLFKIKDWYCDEHNLDDRRTVLRLSKSGGIANPQRAFAACCRGYIEDHWNTRKYLDEQGMIKAITIRTNMVHIRRFLNFCASRDYMEKVEVTIPKVEKTIKEPYSDEDMRKLLARPKSREWIDWRNWAMVNYFYATGQRLSTVLNIKLEHLDLKNARVKLEWNKDKIQKYMPLSSAIIKVLQEYLDLSGLNEQDYLFPECMGKQFSKRGAEDSIADYNRSRGVYKTSIHLFRHTFAKTYIMNGGNPVKLQKLLNHKTLEMTMKYVNLYASDISDDLDLFNPLDNFKRTNYTPTQRRYVIGA